MKIVVFGPDKRTGALHDGNVVDLSCVCAKYLREREGEPRPLEMAEALVPSDLARLIEGGPRALEHAQKALDHLSGRHKTNSGRGARPLYTRPQTSACTPRGPTMPASLAPAETSPITLRQWPSRSAVDPMRLTRTRRSVKPGCGKLGRELLGPDGELTYPERCNRLDYEGEIAIVLGRRGADLKPSQLMDYVWGMTMLGDWSIRAPQERSGGAFNFAFPKNFDTSCSLGPCIAVGEADPTNVDMETLVNGERRQRFNTRDMVFTFGEYLEYLSRDFTLYPGDIISGGTAAGTAADSSELLPDGSSASERFLKPGDLVEMISPAIGALRTRVVAKKK
jgi:2-keto-4-pentenoate hydratase/2-oxohepta-3-ene-1,7-dioic acid hydratase in catechol pathway